MQNVAECHTEDKKKRRQKEHGSEHGKKTQTKTRKSTEKKNTEKNTDCVGLEPYVPNPQENFPSGFSATFWA